MAPAAKGVLSEGEKKLLESIQNGSLEELQRCLSLPDVQVDCLDEHGMTPLQHAAYKGRADMARVLLHQGADVNDRNHEHGYTALMFAAISGNTDVTRLMLEAGGSTSHVNSVGRTAAQMAGFVGQSENASLINNFFSKEDLAYYTVVRGHETEPKLTPALLGPLHSMVLQNNLHPVHISLFLQRHTALLEESVRVGRLLDLLCEKMMKQSNTNEVLAVKFHYLAAVLRHCAQAADMGSWLKSLVRGRDSDGFPERQERLIRAALKDFPYIECQLLQQMVRNIAPVAIGDSPTALNILSSAINGQKFASDEDSCTTCGALNAEKKCSACKMVKYCDQNCQKLHWATHKKFCKSLAEEYRRMMELKEEEERRMKEKQEREEKEKKTGGGEEGSKDGQQQEENGEKMEHLEKQVESTHIQ